MTKLASIPHPSARESIDACQEGEVAICLDVMNLELDAQGMEFAYLDYLTRADGQRVVVAVPVN